MKIIFIYKNNSFNLDVKINSTVDSLKNKISQMIKKDKSSFDILYNNQILSENDLTLSQIIKNGFNIFIVSIRDNKSKKFISRNKNINLPALTISNQSNEFKTESDVFYNDENLNLKESEIFSNSSKKILNIKTKRKTKYVSRNKVFEDIYNQKEEIIINLLNDLKNDILEYDNTLYNNYKNQYDSDNRQLILFEKNILSFKDKQIQFFKKLKNYFDKKEATFFSGGKINLEGFYSELLNYYYNKDSNTFIQTYSMKKERKIINNNNDIKIINYKEKKLPKITITKNTDEIFLQTSRLYKDSFEDNSDEIIKEKKDKIKSNKRQKIKSINPINLNDLSKDSEDNNEIKLNFNDDKATYEKIPKKKNENEFKSENNKTSNEEKPKIEKIIENNKNIQLIKSKSEIADARDLKVNYDKNKIKSLFQTSEIKRENIKNNLEDLDEESSIDNVKDKKIKNRKIIEQNLTERKNYMKHVTHSRIGYKFKLIERKSTLRIKKLGNTFSDFII